MGGCSGKPKVPSKNIQSKQNNKTKNKTNKSANPNENINPAIPNKEQGNQPQLQPNNNNASNNNNPSSNNNPLNNNNASNNNNAPNNNQTNQNDPNKAIQQPDAAQLNPSNSPNNPSTVLNQQIQGTQLASQKNPQNINLNSKINNENMLTSNTKNMNPSDINQVTFSCVNSNLIDEQQKLNQVQGSEQNNVLNSNFQKSYQPIIQKNSQLQSGNQGQLLSSNIRKLSDLNNLNNNSKINPFASNIAGENKNISSANFGSGAINFQTVPNASITKNNGNSLNVMGNINSGTCVQNQGQQSKDQMNFGDIDNNSIKEMNYSDKKNFDSFTQQNQVHSNDPTNIYDQHMRSIIQTYKSSLPFTSHIEQGIPQKQGEYYTVETFGFSGQMV